MLKKCQRKFSWTLIFTFLFGIVFVILRQKSREIIDEISLKPVDWKRVNERRVKIMKETCKKYNLGIYKDPDNENNKNNNIIKYPPAPQYSILYILKKHKFTYCPIYKAGSTTWLHNICLLMRIPEAELSSGREQISTIARRVIPELDYPEAEEAVQGTTKLLVVRHPFERLLSAYRDKLENSIAGREHGTLHFYRKYGAAIVKKYRPKKFIKPRDDQVIQRIGVARPSGIEPTWREFVEYLIDTDLGSYGDDHWMPYYLFCTPCSLDYSLVAKVETLKQDQLFAIEKLGLSELIKPRWQHHVGQTNASKIYFSQLTKLQIKNLYNKFKFDFEMFDYSPDNYYKFALDNNQDYSTTSVHNLFEYK